MSNKQIYMRVIEQKHIEEKIKIAKLIYGITIKYVGKNEQGFLFHIKDATCLISLCQYFEKEINYKHQHITEVMQDLLVARKEFRKSNDTNIPFLALVNVLNKVEKTVIEEALGDYNEYVLQLHGLEEELEKVNSLTEKQIQELMEN